MTDEITITEDGRTLHGSTWIKPQDFATEEVQRGDLASLKGCTPPEWPTLDTPPMSRFFLAISASGVKRKGRATR